MLNGFTFDNQLFTSKAFSVFQNALLDGNDGIVKGVGNECAMTYSGGTITIEDGYFFIQGRLLKIEGSETLTVTQFMNATGYCSVVCEIDLSKTNTNSDLQQASFKILISDSTDYPTAAKEDILNNGDVYQFEFAKFIVTNNIVTNLTDCRKFINNTNKVLYSNVNGQTGDISFVGTTGKATDFKSVKIKGYCKHDSLERVYFEKNIPIISTQTKADIIVLSYVGSTNSYFAHENLYIEENTITRGVQYEFSSPTNAKTQVDCIYITEVIGLNY